MCFIKSFPIKTAIACILIFNSYSCSKDSDLLSEYVVSKNDNIQSISLLADDTFFMAPGQNSLLLDVLNNDSFNSDAQITIVATSTPNNGYVTINEDNTLTYTPQTTTQDTEETVPSADNASTEEDAFTYTAEVTTSDNSTFREEATVTITSGALDQLLAFPGAQGFGKNATGGRGGRVIKVTNLNDSGPGSLRAAVESTGPRTVVFTVSGTIESKDYIAVSENEGDLTIAGQTAPGKGITLKGAELRIAASNVIIRYLRIRPGESTSGTNEDGLRIIAFGGNTTQNVIVDHSSITWGKDEIVEIGGIGTGSKVRNVTIQNSIIGENISSDHKFGLILWNDAKNISIFKNLFIHNLERNIRSSTCTSSFEMVNNVVYSFKAGTIPTYENQFDIIGNVYKSNPKLNPNSNPINISASLNNCPGGNINITKAFIENNIFDGKTVDVSSDILPYLTSNKNFNSGIEAESVINIEETVLNSVGVTKPLRDDVDLRLINETITRTGNLTGKSGALTSYPQIDKTTRPNSYDTDGDGMEDAWELQNNLDPNNPNDGKSIKEGMLYTNLEIFLHSLTL